MSFWNCEFRNIIESKFVWSILFCRIFVNCPALEKNVSGDKYSQGICKYFTASSYISGKVCLCYVQNSSRGSVLLFKDASSTYWFTICVDIVDGVENVISDIFWSKCVQIPDVVLSSVWFSATYDLVWSASFWEINVIISSVINIWAKFPLSSAPKAYFLNLRSKKHA